MPYAQLWRLPANHTPQLRAIRRTCRGSGLGAMTPRCARPADKRRRLTLAATDDEYSAPMDASPRVLDLPASGFASLRTALGILTDQGFADEKLDELDNRLHALWPDPTGADLTSDETRPVGLSQKDADLLMGALRVTEVLSMEFPWYAQLVDTIHFISDQLLELWSNDEWLTFRNA